MNGLSHLKYMLFGGAVLLGGMVAFGVPAPTAALFAVLLVCPLMMVLMAAGGHDGHGSGHQSDDQNHDAHQGTQPPAKPTQARHH